MKLLLSALVLFAASSGASAQDQAKIDAAIEKGVAYIRTSQTPGVTWAGVGDSWPLVLMTLVHAGVPESDPKVQELLQKIIEEPLTNVYLVVLQAMTLEEVDRVKYQGRLAQCAQFLVDNQCQNGQWSYGEPTVAADALPLPKSTASGASRKGVREFGTDGFKVKPKVTRKLAVRKTKEGPAKGDNSNAQYAALGLRACQDAGISVPRDVLVRAKQWWIESQHPVDPDSNAVATSVGISAPPRGWCYNKSIACDKVHRPYAAMTAGAVASLAILDHLLDLDSKKNAAIQSGLAWLSAHWSVTTNEGPAEIGEKSPKTELYYYLYALERVGMLYGIEKVGDKNWYAEGAQAILAAQKPENGSWLGGDPRCKPTWDTCFAILFLKKATRPMVASEARR